VATKKELDKIVQATQREKRALKGKAKIALKVGKVINKFKVAKHFHLCIGEDHFSNQLREDRIAEEVKRESVVEPARRSPSAQQKARSKRTKENLPVHSFRTLLDDLATISKNLIQPRLKRRLRVLRKQHCPPLCRRRLSAFSG
jgi:hypothetical protein